MKLRKTDIQGFGLFPLPMVVLPGEVTRLHIFEPQYKALINDCFASDKGFVIPFIIDGEVSSIGILVKLVDVERFYPDGKMDIKVQGHKMVRITQFESAQKHKYALGTVTILKEDISKNVLGEVEELVHEINFNDPAALNTIQDIAIYAIANSLALNTKTKQRLAKCAHRPDLQSRIILNELRMKAVPLRTQNVAGYKYYMN
jgi:Lon protease-like protein